MPIHQPYAAVASTVSVRRIAIRNQNIACLKQISSGQNQENQAGRAAHHFTECNVENSISKNENRKRIQNELLQMKCALLRAFESWTCPAKRSPLEILKPRIALLPRSANANLETQNYTGLDADKVS